MSPSFEIQTTVLPGHRIEVETPDIPEGQEVTVVVLTSAGPPKRRLNEILADYQGGQLFRSADEVDAYLRAERESWDK
jgi:hypothetical protein